MGGRFPLTLTHAPKGRGNPGWRFFSPLPSGEREGPIVPAMGA